MPDINGYDDQNSNDAGSFEEMIARLMNAQNGQNSGAFGRPIDISRLLSRRSHDVLRQAGEFATSHGHAEVDALHILRVLVEQHPAVDAIRHAGADVDSLVRSIEGRLPGAAADAPQRPQLTPSAQRLLLEAAQAARAFGSTYVDPEHLFFALVVNEGAVSGQLLHSVGVTPQSLQAFVRDASQGGAPATAGRPGRPGTIGAENDGPASETPTLDQFGTDLTARAAAGDLDPVIGRADEIQQTIEILLRRTVLTKRGWLFFLVTCICLAISASYELLEWAVAVAQGSAADAFLGTQGDPWDTQSDMLCALIGAIAAQLLLARWHNRQMFQWNEAN